MPPEEPLRRARVDAAMDWHHSTVRKGAAGQVHACLDPHREAP